MWLADNYTNHGLHIIVILVIHDSPVEGGRGGAVVADVVIALALATAVVVFAAAVVVFAAAVAIVVVVVVAVAVVVYAQMSHCQSLPHQVLLYIQRFQRHT